MRKAFFKRLVSMLYKSKRGFTKVVDNPSGTKLRRAADQTDKRRGVDYTMR